MINFIKWNEQIEIRRPRKRRTIISKRRTKKQDIKKDKKRNETLQEGNEQEKLKQQLKDVFRQIVDQLENDVYKKRTSHTNSK